MSADNHEFTLIFMRPETCQDSIGSQWADPGALWWGEHSQVRMLCGDGEVAGFGSLTDGHWSLVWTTLSDLHNPNTKVMICTAECLSDVVGGLVEWAVEQCLMGESLWIGPHTPDDDDGAIDWMRLVESQAKMSEQRE